MKTSDALTYFGSASKLALGARVSRQAVAKWGRVVPYRTALYLQEFTANQLTVDESLYDDRKAAKYRRRA
jgi:DNA-binding transcriptional regulator Cro